jgi:transposase-like protein
MHNPFRYFNSSPEVIRLTVMMYVRFPLSLRQVEDLLHERGIDICHETVRHWWNRFGPMFAAELRKRRVHHQSYSNWRWHLDEVFVRINGVSTPEQKYITGRFKNAPLGVVQIAALTVVPVVHRRDPRCFV